ncbi:MAG: hypothetical protein BWK72_10250 [Rhodoferax ferrireducens]|uniref:Glycosyltransferase RgtA/B/C/D-like domain-containing protein n=2 Tax=Pseudomonadota TaxID=1224 RepID=A0A1W9KUC2_9BURK|nr:MAG: hypothetical protein BWK72_10250 [Rhodoferax ferrireducens]
MFAGASLATRMGWHHDPLPLALISLGGVSLGMFYLASGMPDSWRWTSIVVVLAASAVAIRLAGPDAHRQTALQLMPYARIWGVASLVYFAVLSLAYNGLGHWEPNYRFWPATWSSDNELPWLFAEAIRHGWDLKGLFGGGWLPTDRPPLMAGAHLLLSDVFGLLQANNDGDYLRGSAYNAAAVALNALWVPVVWWLLKNLGRGLDDRDRLAILVFIACIPFVLFNTVYGWPKAFGAAFALLAFGLAWQSRNLGAVVSNKSTILIFFALGAFSMLAHSSTALFLAPLGLLFLFWNLRSNTRTVLVGFGIAMALLASWSFYKMVILPSADPVTKYALTGDYGFGHPEWSLWQMLTDRYGEMGFWQWLAIKRIMLLQVFLPLHHSVTQIGLNTDFGAGEIDKLRAWDFMLLSKGNLALPFFVVIAAWVSLSAFALRRRDVFQNQGPFLALAWISVIAWLLIVLGFLVPPVLHVWPQAAVFGLALGGAVVTYQRYPMLFGLMLILLISYTGAVWIISPLQSALAIDMGAALVLAAFASWRVVSTLLPITLRNDQLDLNTINDASFRQVLVSLRADGTLQRIGNAPIWSHAVHLLAAAAFLFCTYIALRYIHQPLVDVHAFRQSQTALSTFWMLKEGWSLAYQTPVAGFTWAIPFEFPIYQTLVAAIVAVTGFELEAMGRFVSYTFLVACAWPVFLLSKRLGLPKSVPWVFCILLWTSPLNVYWGRTFMIETTALFFALACLPYALDLIRRVGGWRSELLFVAFATAAVLQKSTTGGPVLLFLFMAVVFVQLRKTGLSLQTVRDALYPVAVICVPLVIGLAWAHYADVVKMANPFGSQLTSKALSQWNFGTMQQKLDPETWRLVVWERSLSWNAGGWLGVVLVLLPWLGGSEHRKLAWLSLAALTLFLLPVLIFTNLHFVHEYYQVACVVFLLGALAIVIGGWLPKATGMTLIVPVATLAIALPNLAFFSKTYGVVTARTLDELDPRSVQSYKVGRFLRDHTQPGSGLVVFGQGYSSEIAYQAQRKTMAAPPWFKEYRQLWDQPQKYLGNVPLSAIVICPPTDDFPTIRDMNSRLQNELGWKNVSVNGCQVLLRVTDMDSNL